MPPIQSSGDVATASATPAAPVKLTPKLMLSTTIYSTCLSPCGKYFAAGNNFGHIMLFKISGSTIDTEGQKPVFVFQGNASEHGAIHSLLTVEGQLVSAGFGPVRAWSWADLVQFKVKKLWQLDVNNSCNGGCVNSIKYSVKDSLLYTCGNVENNIVSWDLKKGMKVDTYTGHLDYVHDISLMPNGLVSASEDGSMRVWDSRNTECSSFVEPYKRPELSRPNYGKFLSSVTSDAGGDWIVCGGGPKLALFRPNMPEFCKPLEEERSKNLVPNVVEIYNDEIIAGGQQRYLYRWHMNGDKKAVVPCDQNSVFSITSQVDKETEKRKLPLILSGADYKMSVFNNLGYQSMTFKCI